MFKTLNTWFWYFLLLGNASTASLDIPQVATWGCQQKPRGRMGGKSLAWLQQMSAEGTRMGCPEWKSTHGKGIQSRERAWWGWTRMGGVWSFVFFWNALREDVHRELWIHCDWGIKPGVMKSIFLEVCVNILVVVALGGTLPKDLTLF